VLVAARVQAPAAEKLPAPLLEKLTVPVGVDFDPLAVSLTVAVQVVGAFSATEDGAQPTLVEVVRKLAAVPVARLWLGGAMLDQAGSGPEEAAFACGAGARNKPEAAKAITAAHRARLLINSRKWPPA
jgi:hypothetical protein